MGATAEPALEASGVSINRSGNQVVTDISFRLTKGDHLAILGESGSGKTSLGLALAGKLFYKGAIHYAACLRQNIVWLAQQHHFKNRSNTTDLYYQQRFNSYDSEDTQTVEESLSQPGYDIDVVLQGMHIAYLRDKPLIQLSNGENKKLQVAKALQLSPSVLIMDQPFTGLDAETRTYLHALLDRLALQGMQLILITSPDEIPACINKVLVLGKGKKKAFGDKVALLSSLANTLVTVDTFIKNKAKLAALSPAATDDFAYAIRMEQVNVAYGEKPILQQINWEVKKGERWLLSGPNGAGKSTLLSLVTADNPQAYANGVYLFDQKRGSGESIWDIKKKIGFLSPELHVYFDQGCTGFEAIASGFFDTIGLFRQLSEADIQTVYDWAAIAGVEALLPRRLGELAAGEQRMLLLIRALVKNPPLLVLDEPCQGIDVAKQAQLLELVNAVCEAGHKTMVFVTHYAEARPACINRFLKLDKGKVIEVFNNPNG